MKSVFGLAIILGFWLSLPVHAQAASAESIELFKRVADVSHQDYLFGALVDVHCKDPQSFAEGQAYVAQQLEQLKMEEIEYYHRAENAVNSFGGIETIVTKKQYHRKSTAVVLLNQRHNQLEKISAKACP